MLIGSQSISAWCTSVHYGAHYFCSLFSAFLTTVLIGAVACDSADLSVYEKVSLSNRAHSAATCTDLFGS